MPPRADSFATTELPDFVRERPDLGRVVWLFSVYSHETGQWSAYIPDGGGGFIRMHPQAMLSGTYLSSAPERGDDFLDPLATVLFQHLSFPDLFGVFRGISEDLINSLSLVHNYFVLVDHANRHGGFAARKVIAAVIEAMLTTHRSFYDLLNRLVSKTVKHTNLKGVTIGDSFAGMTQKSAEDLLVKFRLPQVLVSFYKQREKRFMTLRAVRDNIVHHGQSPQLIYNYDTGFGVGLDDKVAAALVELEIWHEDSLEKNRIGSVLSLLTFLMADMFGVLQELASAMQQSFTELPLAVAPGLQAFSRSELMFHHANAPRYMESPWQDPVPLLKLPEAQTEDGQPERSAEETAR